MGAWLEEWVTHHTETERSTRSDYRRVIRKHLAPAFGAVKLTDLSPRMIQQWQSRMLGSYAPASVLQYRSILSTALGQAVRMELLDRNPVSLVKAPRVPVKRQRVWDEGEVARVIASADDQQERLYLRLALTTGMRPGEIIALTWDAVDLERGLLSVSSHMQTDETGSYLTEGAKSQAGERDIHLDRSTLAELRSWSVEQKRIRLRTPMWRDQGLLFTNVYARGGVFGGPVSRSAPDRWVRRAAERAGATALSPHGLRHTWASIALAKGVPITVVSQRLGHANPSITLRIYAHALPGGDRLAADLMDELYG
ncbi:MAG: site-specific integrase [Gammaproteobacteria bacterium]|nr:site-specific integrase [Gammaproteobacteria bacterium]